MISYHSLTSVTSSSTENEEARENSEVVRCQVDPEREPTKQGAVGGQPSEEVNRPIVPREPVGPTPQQLSGCPANATSVYHNGLMEPNAAQASPILAANGEFSCQQPENDHTGEDSEGASGCGIPYQGDDRQTNRRTVHSEEDNGQQIQRPNPQTDSDQTSGCILPVQETGIHFAEQRVESGQVLTRNDQRQAIEQICGRQEMQLMNNYFSRMRLSDELSDDIEGRLCNGKFTWKIKGFRQRRQEAIRGVVTALFSPPIYTKNGDGYNFCMRLHLSGVDTGAGSHVALFVHMLQGEYDHRLRWPFAGAITLSILEQSNSQHRNDVIESVTASPDLLAFQMPSATCCHIGCGFEKFAPIAQVCGPQYVKNDTMLIRIEIFQ